jgi:hypothetical protein
MAIAGPAFSIDLFDDGPIYTQANFAPLVYLHTDGGRVLFDDPYGFYANGNIEERTNNYAFTGEQIQWRVLVWDKNGVPEKISDVFAGWVAQENGPLDPEIQVNCQFYTGYDALADGALLDPFYTDVREPGSQYVEEYFDAQTMGEYLCTLTIEPTCVGQKWLGVMAVDIEGDNGTMIPAESWFCNPELDLYVSGSLSFGAIGPGQHGSTTFSIENNGTPGSGVQVVLALSGSDFYDPMPSGGMCPTSNFLALPGVEAPSDTVFDTGFWYRAVKGSLTTDDVAPNSYGYKRIPYGTILPDADPLFSNSNSGLANPWTRWTGGGTPSLLDQALSPGSEATVTLYLGIPVPCNGQFTDGSIYLWAWAI